MRGKSGHAGGGRVEGWRADQSLRRTIFHNRQKHLPGYQFGAVKQSSPPALPSIIFSSPTTSTSYTSSPPGRATLELKAGRALLRDGLLALCCRLRLRLAPDPYWHLRRQPISHRGTVIHHTWRSIAGHAFISQRNATELKDHEVFYSRHENDGRSFQKDDRVPRYSTSSADECSINALFYCYGYAHWVSASALSHGNITFTSFRILVSSRGFPSPPMPVIPIPRRVRSFHGPHTTCMHSACGPARTAQLVRTKYNNFDLYLKSRWMYSFVRFLLYFGCSLFTSLLWVALSALFCLQYISVRIFLRLQYKLSVILLLLGHRRLDFGILNDLFIYSMHVTMFLIGGLGWCFMVFVDM
ncbi:hypothetical protein Q8A67_003546 [Cirrhinus molitorella]|uniref:Transmembrane protein 250 n=2 Tax=Labeoninae TaxID=2743695 RepID=A0AA88Q5C0_9TELE|nr:hypothetical protein Q8A67_003546 [Cirrhinus molitorella]